MMNLWLLLPLLLPMLAVAGSLAAKKTVPDGPGTFPTATPLFMGMLVLAILQGRERLRLQAPGQAASLS